AGPPSTPVLRFLGISRFPKTGTRKSAPPPTASILLAAPGQRFAGMAVPAFTMFRRPPCCWRKKKSMPRHRSVATKRKVERCGEEAEERHAETVGAALRPKERGLYSSAATDMVNPDAG